MTYHYLGSAELALDAMCDRVTVHRDSHKMLASLLACLADGIGNFVCLAKAHTYFSLHVANNNEGAEGKVLAAFHDFAAAVDVHHALFKLGLAIGNDRALKFTSVYLFLANSLLFILVCHGMFSQSRGLAAGYSKPHRAARTIT